MTTAISSPNHPSARALLLALGVDPDCFTGGTLAARSPITGAITGAVHQASPAAMQAAIGRAQSAFYAWRSVPAPRRGELVRLFSDELRAHQTTLAALVTLETGKVTSEGAGEVQEMIDICEFAVGLSRQLHGLTIASERPGHRMMEQWHPLGVVGVISAFNFPVAVWAWNAALALVCGNAVVWKPSEKTPLTALACQSLFEQARARFDASGDPAPAALSQVLNGGAVGAEQDAAQRQVEVGAGGDDDGVVAAQLQQAAAKTGGHPGAHGPAHAGGAGG